MEITVPLFFFFSLNEVERLLKLVHRRVYFVIKSLEIYTLVHIHGIFVMLGVKTFHHCYQ